MTTASVFPTTYQILPNGIHQIAMQESSRVAVDMWLTRMTDLMYTLYAEGGQRTVPVLLDLRGPGMMPVAYATYAVRLWREEYNYPPAIDLAVVYRYGLLAKLAQSFSALTSVPDGVQLFHMGRYNDATDWLLSRTDLAEAR